LFYSKSAAGWSINAAGELFNFLNKRRKILSVLKAFM